MVFSNSRATFSYLAISCAHPLSSRVTRRIMPQKQCSQVGSLGYGGRCMQYLYTLIAQQRHSSSQMRKYHSRRHSSNKIRCILWAAASVDAIINNCNLFNFQNTTVLEDKWLSGSAEVWFSIRSQISRMFKPVRSLLKSNGVMTEGTFLLGCKETSTNSSDTTRQLQ